MASIFTKFFGRTVSEAAGVAAGIAVASPLRPVVQLVENETWALHPDKPVPATLAAAIVAEDVERDDWGRTQASYTGFSGDAFEAMLGETLNAPGLGPLFELWRRGLIADGDFVHGLRKAKLEGRWDGPLEGLRETLLSTEELANLQQQGFIDPARANQEGSLQGVTEERQQLRFEAAGLPPGWAEGLTMLRRGIITEAEFAEIVRTGHTKTKWTPQLLELRNVVLSAAEYATLHLKGWITVAEMNAGGALTGHTPEQMDLLYKAHGRPASPTQMATAWARGVDGPEGRPVDEPQFLKAIAQSDIRPEYGPTLWGIRYAYPPLFQISRLVTAGAIDAATAVDWAKKDRYAPEVVSALEAFWSGGTTAGADKHVTKAEGQLWTTLHTSYRADETDAATATTTLGTLGVAASAIPQVLALWDAEKALRRKQLTPAQVKKAYRGAITNQDTGQPYTRDDALAALLERGYSTAQANEFLDL